MSSTRTSSSPSWMPPWCWASAKRWRRWRTRASWAQCPHSAARSSARTPSSRSTRRASATSAPTSASTSGARRPRSTSSSVPSTSVKWWSRWRVASSSTSKWTPQVRSRVFASCFWVIETRVEISAVIYKYRKFAIDRPGAKQFLATHYFRTTHLRIITYIYSDRKICILSEYNCIIVLRCVVKKLCVAENCWPPGLS